MKKLLSILVLSICCNVSAYAVITGEMIMIRSPEPFPEAMSLLQQAITKQGYQLSRVQRVDVGLSAKGYKTDKYRVVFFGKGQQIKELSRKFPELIPYLPLKIAIFAEDNNTILITANPEAFRDMFRQPELTPVFEQWKSDLSEILNAVQTHE